MKKADLKGFADEIINCAFNGHGAGGDEIQDIGVKHNLLIEVNADGPCGDDCACTEYGFPTLCYRKNYL